MSKLSIEDLSAFLVLEVTWSHHSYDSEVDCSWVVESHHHFLLELWVWYLGTDGYSSFNGFLNLGDHWHQFCWGVSAGTVGKTTCGGVQSRNLEKSVSLFNVIRSNHQVQSHLGDGLWKSDNGFKLSNSNWNTVGFLWNSLIFRLLSICNVHVLEHQARLLAQLWSDILFGVASVLSHEVDWNIALVLLLLGVHM